MLLTTADAPPVAADAILHIAIVCFQAGLTYAPGAPASAAADDPAATWVRLAIAHHEAAERIRATREHAVAPPWLRKLAAPEEEDDGPDRAHNPD